MSKLSCITSIVVATLAFAITPPPAAAHATHYSGVVAYGDSLSDNGNLYAASGQPAAPYFNGRRSDGPVAVERLASTLGIPLIDFAWIGATTGVGNYADYGNTTAFGLYNLPGMQTELTNTQPFLVPYLADGLFVVWAGANDFLAPSPLDTSPADIITRAVFNILGVVNSLDTLGAQHILVPGMPDLGLTPYFQSLGAGVAAQASAITEAFNAALLASLPVDVDFYDTAALLRSMVANPAMYGFTNVSDACFDGVSLCANPSGYLYFDDFHPTTATAAFAAQGFLHSTVPEPPLLALVLLGLVLSWVARRRST